MEFMTPFKNPAVEKVFNAYPEGLRQKLLWLRQLIFDTAAEIREVGPLEETLKWGQPSYLTPVSKSGSTLRIDRIKSTPDQYAIFVNCQTSLLASYRELFPDKLEFAGKRCLTFNLDEDPPEDVVRQCIGLALTYHLNKRRDGLPF